MCNNLKDFTLTRVKIVKILGVGLIEQALIHFSQGKGQAGALEKGKELRLRLITPDMEGGQNHRPTGFFESREDSPECGSKL